MHAVNCRKFFVALAAGAISMLMAGAAAGQSARNAVPAEAAAAAQEAQIRALADSVHDLQTQVQALSAELRELRSRQAASGEQSPNAGDPRHEYAKPAVVVADEAATDAPAALKIQPGSLGTQVSPDSGYGGTGAGAAGAARSDPRQIPAPASAASLHGQANDDRLAKLEEDQQFIDAKINDQYQTKVESGSKYRLRLSGMVLLNLFETRGTVDNFDFPETAAAKNLLGSAAAFGGSLRQSQLGLEAFGPDIAGAHTSADIKLDFAGGFAEKPNGVVEGIVRLRTGTVRFDWANTSIIGGQDHLFFAPLAPTSLASVAVPALSYSGNLWSWTPQLRVEHRHVFSERSSILFQAGILDTLSGDIPDSTYLRYPSWGEASGQPAYATRISWSQHAWGQNIVAGVGGYFGRQDWGFNRSVDGWAGTADLTLPFGKFFGLTAAFYRGRALGGLGGGIGQSILIAGNLTLPNVKVAGLDSMGGWAQLKFKPRTNFEINAALGVDNPFSSELRHYSPQGSYYGIWLTKNVSPFVNFIYHVRSNVLFSLEYRHLQTFVLDDGSHSAGQVNMSVGYLF